MPITVSLDQGRSTQIPAGTQASPIPDRVLYPHRVFAVWAREHAPGGGSGRDKIVINLKEVLNQYAYQSITARNLVERRGLSGLAWLLVRYVLTRQPKALQLALYNDKAEIARIVDAAVAYRPDLVIIDTVRLIKVAEAVRHHLPEVRLVIDMDDLMSRRYDELANKAAPLNLGFVDRFVPKVLVRAAGGLAKSIHREEADGLRAAEMRALKIADTIVLVSPAEAQQLRAFEQAHMLADKQTDIRAILPPNAIAGEMVPPPTPPIHFIFIGSDRLHQNAMTIDYLVDFWRRREPKYSLRIFGRMTRRHLTPPNVHFMGFARNLSTVYADNGVLLCPAFLAGGIKTKILEAFSFGVPVVGTALSFEGMTFAYPLHFDNLTSLEDFVMNADEKTDILRAARDAGHAYVRQNCDIPIYEAQWRMVLAGIRAGQPTKSSSVEHRSTTK